MAEDKPAKTKISVPDQAELVIRADASKLDSGAAEVRIEIPKVAAVLALRNVVVFPGMVAPLPVGRERSKRLLESS